MRLRPSHQGMVVVLLVVAGVEEDGGWAAWLEADLELLGGDVDLAGGLDEVAEDGVGGGGLVAG